MVLRKAYTSMTDLRAQTGIYFANAESNLKPLVTSSAGLSGAKSTLKSARVEEKKLKPSLLDHSVIWTVSSTGHCHHLPATLANIVKNNSASHWFRINILILVFLISTHNTNHSHLDKLQNNRLSPGFALYLYLYRFSIETRPLRNLCQSGSSSQLYNKVYDNG